MTTEELKKKARLLRYVAVDMVYKGKDGHPGPALSIADIVATLYFDKMNIRPEEPDWEDRDRFILSKGHSCPIYYAALSERGYFGDRVEDFKLRALGSKFQGHPVMNKTRGVDMTSGSLGNGLAIAGGMAIAGKYSHKDYYVYVVAGDGELQEGVCWEGINAAAAHKLDHIIAFIDKNGWQSGGSVEDTMGSNNIAERFEAFKWDVQEIDGHDIDAIRAAVDKAKQSAGKPHAIICNCVKGKGVSYMENDNAWHKGVPTDEQYETAKAELGGVM
ncbi:transketolase [Enterocloster aldenensis]|uniref:transketolase n=1 Tax=Enterocloster aldenensis TaxID=358742 RepID=UPI000E4B6654|nr:transketolase [Enterocloster aldenensis]